MEGGCSAVGYFMGVGNFEASLLGEGRKNANVFSFLFSKGHQGMLVDPML